jgi:dihydrofolate synthase/folylpolyglutamate synthase
VNAKTSDLVLERLGRLHPKLIDLSLGRVERLLAALDNPQEKLPPVIHVAGTNGKGSTPAGIAWTPISRRILCASTSVSALPGS